jgi:hypothetical protein
VESKAEVIAHTQAAQGQILREISAEELQFQLLQRACDQASIPLIRIGDIYELKEADTTWPALIGTEIMATENFPNGGLTALTKLQPGNKIGPAKEVRAWFKIDKDEGGGNKLNIYSSILHQSQADPSKDAWVIITCDSNSYLKPFGNMEDSGGYCSRVYGNAKVEDLQDSPNEADPPWPLLRDQIPKCSNNPKMFGPDIDDVLMSDLYPEPEETGDSFVQNPIPAVAPQALE